MTRLQNGDKFPRLELDIAHGGTMVLPGAFAGSYSVVLFFRGSWCPYCAAQLAAFSRARDTFEAIGIKVVALSVDDEATSKAFAKKLGLSFLVGFGANAHDISAVTGAYVAGGSSAYLQSMGFVLDRQGRILTAVYSSGAIGRLVPDDVVGFVNSVEADRESGHESVSATETPARNNQDTARYLSLMTRREDEMRDVVAALQPPVLQALRGA